MGRGKTTRQARREEPAPRPIVLPASAETEDTPIAEVRTAPVAQTKQKKSQGPSTIKSKRQREKAVKAAEFAQRLEAKAAQKERRQAKKLDAKKLWD
ncbi:hypothetical protein EMMF5_001224 [Cystobasidiomycetes sp. EMM_F5]